ncbi:fimbrillin family protein [Bacteroides sp.]
MKHVILFFFALLIFSGCNDDKNADVIDPILPVSISGCVQKGPFITGTSIRMQELDDNLNPTGKSFETQIEKDNGSFAVSGEISSRYVEIIANGYYYNEVVGELSSAPITLRAIFEASDKESLNVNVLTSLQSQRIKKLIKDGMEFKKASQQSQQEVLKVFGIEQNDIPSFDQMDISQKGDANAILLAISSIMQDDRTEGELSELLAKVTSDIQADGTLNQESLKASLSKSTAGLNNLQVQANLRKRYEALGMKDATVPDFYGYLDSDGDGVLNCENNYLVVEKTELYSRKEQSTDTLYWSANFVPEISVPVDVDWIKVVECTKERMVLSLNEGGNYRGVDLILTSPDGKISKEIYVSKQGMFTSFNVKLLYGNSSNYLDDIVKNIQVLGFDKDGRKIFCQYDQNPIITNDLYSCSVDLNGEEYTDVTMYTIINSPYDFSTFAGTMQEMQNMQFEVDLGTAENIENFLMGKVDKVSLSSSGVGSHFGIPMKLLVAKLKFKVTYSDLNVEEQLGAVEAITLKDIHSKSGSFFSDKQTGTKNNLTIVPDANGEFSAYVYSGSSLNSIVVKTAKEDEQIVDLSIPIDCMRGKLYNIVLKLKSTEIESVGVVVSPADSEHM